MPGPQEREPGVGGQGPGELKPPPAQELFERQGYLIIADNGARQHRIGDVVHQCFGGDGYRDLECPMLIVGTATGAEWEAQAASVGGLADARGWARFWKVVAE
jgi:hypothetical protein